MKLTLYRKLILIGALIGLAGCASAPSYRASPALHPNLAAAQTFIEKAMDKISAAQRANDFDMNGHAARAKVLLDQAYAEIKLAAMAANVNR